MSESTKTPGPDADAIEAADKKYVMRPWSNPAGEPVIVAKARGCTITDIHGKEYLDLTAGYFVNNAGHCHPRIIEAATAQMQDVLQISGKPGTIPVVKLAKRLTELAPPQKWWDRLDRARKARGILLIADEVQTGLGRTGKMFAVEHYGLEPEIMTGGKGLSGGVGSLAATMASDAVCKGFFGGTTPTSAGNAVSAAAGLAMIEILATEGLVDNAA